MTYLGLDGYVRLYRVKGGSGALLGEKYYDKVGFPNGNANFVLVVEGDGMTILVNENKVLHAHDQAFATGGLYYTMVSGTNKGYGFHC
jgi:DNA topoisomerase VI subunit A